jgi:hypothetical protein
MIPMIRGLLVRSTPAAAVALSSVLAAAAFTIAAPPASAEVRRPCGKTRILFLSDSHALGHFGEVVERWLTARPGAEVHTYAMGGSSPQWWFKGNIAEHGHVFHSCDGPPRPRKNLKHVRSATPLITELMSVPVGTYEREVVIVAQGTNVPGTPSIYKEWSARLVKAIQPSRQRVCVWVAPPKMRDRSARYSDQIFAAIQEGLQSAAGDGAPCQLIDSRKYSEYPETGGDGVHYTFSAAGITATTKWAQGIITELKPVLPDPPDPAPP